MIPDGNTPYNIRIRGFSLRANGRHVDLGAIDFTKVVPLYVVRVCASRKYPQYMCVAETGVTPHSAHFAANYDLHPSVASEFTGAAAAAGTTQLAL